MPGLRTEPHESGHGTHFVLPAFQSRHTPSTPVQADMTDLPEPDLWVSFVSWLYQSRRFGALSIRPTETARLLGSGMRWKGLGSQLQKLGQQHHPLLRLARVDRLTILPCGFRTPMVVPW